MGSAPTCCTRSRCPSSSLPSPCGWLASRPRDARSRTSTVPSSHPREEKPMKIDVFNHFTPIKVYERLKQLAPDNPGLKAFGALPALWDLDARLKLMEQFPDVQQVLSLANPPLELLAGPNQTPELAKLANDELAAVCARHPILFPTFIASMP